MATYHRRHGTRDRYEVVLVEALVACGYDVVLTSDLIDEVYGQDAHDLEFDIPIDFYIGWGGERLALKLLKEERLGVLIFRVEASLVDDLCCLSSRKGAMLKLAELYDTFLSFAKSAARIRRQAELVQIDPNWALSA